MSVQERPASPPQALDAETHALVEELFQVVRAGETARIKGLLAMGLVPNLRDSKGDSLLMLASYHGHAEMADLLLKHGADPELANDRCQTPLAGAAFKGDIAMARLLLQHGADANGRIPGGKTPIMFAAMFDRADMIDLLLEHGADPSFPELGLSTTALAGEVPV
ncbi:ankyrin repeat domain-containing protein [Alteromonas pelagimontana]|uniref:Ankyrin repeat domain-containing protein n=2 Tax=Alteromonas pelagimontana TaxID=1858656 RepID=A0A6M4MJM8_9ALTE|nr:ankyrin repeat domain-containing protein [Alteromonas pelagimontana]